MTTTLTISPAAFDLALPEFFAAAQDFAQAVDVDTAGPGRWEAEIRAAKARREGLEDQARKWQIAALALARRIALSIPAGSRGQSPNGVGTLFTADERKCYRYLAAVPAERFREYATTSPAPSFTGAWKLGRPRAPSKPRGPSPTAETSWAQDVMADFVPAADEDETGDWGAAFDAVDDARVALDQAHRVTKGEVAALIDVARHAAEKALAALDVEGETVE